MNLADTKVTDAGLKHLAGMKSQSSLTVQGSAITPAAIVSLQKTMPQSPRSGPPSISRSAAGRAVRPTSRLKPLLIPIWNATHRVGWLAYDYLGALASGRVSRCTVCGRSGLSIYQRRVICAGSLSSGAFRPGWPVPSLARSHVPAPIAAPRCGQDGSPRSCSRALPRRGLPCPVAGGWVEHAAIRKLRVSEINTIDGLHSYLRTLPLFSGSDYQGEKAPASRAATERSEDLTRLTYHDNAFDIILTSETLEHVPDLHAALCEIHRVLGPAAGISSRCRFCPRLSTHSRGQSFWPTADSTTAPPRICHPGGDWGYPVFTEFGTDLPALLSKAGFDTDVHFGPVSEDDVAQVYVCRKHFDQTIREFRGHHT